jgi:hypothetical protein
MNFMAYIWSLSIFLYGHLTHDQAAGFLAAAFKGDMLNDTTLNNANQIKSMVNNIRTKMPNETIWPIVL